MRKASRTVWLFAVGLTIGFALVAITTRAFAGRHFRSWTAVASAEGLVGYRDSCGGRVTTWQTGTAALLPCGARLTLWKGRRKVHVTVMDHGPYVPGRSLDVWPATERALGYRSDAAWGVQSVRMAMGWR